MSFVQHRLLGRIEDVAQDARGLFATTRFGAWEPVFVALQEAVREVRTRDRRWHWRATLVLFLLLVYFLLV